MVKEELQAIAAMSALTKLDAGIGTLSAAGCAALATMTQLQALQLSCFAAGAPVEMPDLKCWTRLTMLACDVRGVGKNVVCQHLRLPGSIKELALPDLPAMPQLDQLHTLELYSGSPAAAAELAALAGGCRNLGKLTVWEPQLSKACHAAPLHKLTELCAYSVCSTELGTCMAAVFPAMRSLSLSCKCIEFQCDWYFFDGLTALVELNVGRARPCCKLHVQSLLCLLPPTTEF